MKISLYIAVVLLTLSTVTGVLLISPRYAVAQQMDCAIWGNMALTLATARDAGVTYAVQLKKIDGLNPKKVGSQEIAMARNIAKLVYRDFQAKTPAELSAFVQMLCSGS